MKQKMKTQEINEIKNVKLPVDDAAYSTVNK